MDKKINDLSQYQPFHDMQLINPGTFEFKLPKDVNPNDINVALTKDHVYKKGKLGFKDVLISELIDVKPGGEVEVKGSKNKGFELFVH